MTARCTQKQRTSGTTKRKVISIDEVEDLFFCKQALELMKLKETELLSRSMCLDTFQFYDKYQELVAKRKAYLKQLIILKEKFDSLPKRVKQILVLKCIHKCQPEEICKKLNISMRTMYRQVQTYCGSFENEY